MWLRRLLLAATLLSGCANALIVPERDGGADSGPVVDAGPRDATMDGCAVTQDLSGIPDGCVLLRPPPRPRCFEDGEVPPIEVAFLGSNVAPDVGYDLDGYCTTSIDAPSSCTNPGSNLIDSTAGGTDNAFGAALVRVLASFSPNFQRDLDSRMLELGGGAPMLRIEGWNGRPDDDGVSVTFAVAASTSSPTPIDWASTPTLHPADGFFTTSGVPLARDLNAYVAGGQLVAELPDGIPFELLADGRRMMLAVRDARVVATIDSTGARDFIVFGRWPLADAREAVDTLVPCASDADEFARMGIRTLFDGSADIRASAGEDRSGLACNAMSAAISFQEGNPIAWGDPRPLEVETMCD